VIFQQQQQEQCSVLLMCGCFSFKQGVFNPLVTVVITESLSMVAMKGTAAGEENLCERL
jgi:hypothetical protein